MKVTRFEFRAFVSLVFFVLGWIVFGVVRFFGGSIDAGLLPASWAWVVSIAMVYGALWEVR